MLPFFALIAVIAGVAAGIHTGRRDLIILGGMIAGVLYIVHKLREAKWEPEPDREEQSEIDDGWWTRPLPQVPPPPAKAPGIHVIECQFAHPVVISGEQFAQLSDVLSNIARSNTPAGQVHWLAEQGYKPLLCQADARALGKEPDPNAPELAEPAFDPSILCFETHCREVRPEDDHL